MTASTEQVKFKNTSAAKGSWVRSPTMFHNTISSDASATYPPESGRYRLYISYACPWAHRTFIMRKLKGLEKAISLTVTHFTLPNVGFTSDQSKEYKGWEFRTEGDLHKDNSEGNFFYEPHGFSTLSQLYELAHPGYTAEFKELAKRPVYSVPVLFDEKTQTIVSNESSEIIVMLNEKFNDFCETPKQASLNLNQESLREEMGKVNAIVYPGINDGVYRCGFARTQQAYEDAYNAHWKAMDDVEEILAKRRFLTGDAFTLSDVRLFVTLIRYDAVYYAHFKTSRNRIREMPNLLRFLKEVYNMEGIKETVSIEHIVKHYYGSQQTLNPTGIWPLGVLGKDELKYLEN